MATVTTAYITHPSDLIIATALNFSAYSCESCTYSLLRMDVPKNENAHSRNYGPFKTKNKKHDPKLIKFIQIDNFSDTTLFLTAGWPASVTEEKLSFSIGRQAFELWLYQTCRLDWCLAEISYKHEDKNTEDRWLYDQYGITQHDLITYIVETSPIIQFPFWGSRSGF